jgi:hypothetical protein
MDVKLEQKWIKILWATQSDDKGILAGTELIAR